MAQIPPTSNTRKRRRSTTSPAEQAEMLTTLPSPLPGGGWSNTDTNAWITHHNKRIRLVPNLTGLDAQQPTFHVAAPTGGHIPPGPPHVTTECHPEKPVSIPAMHDVTFPSPASSSTDPVETLSSEPIGTYGPGYTPEYQEINRLLSQLHTERLQRLSKSLGGI
ncbi:hypothetical protein IWQ61_006419 [Dispira simplex]|nr:hypothetical protein IWQ61_006419 [Dispira simplex]